MDFVSVLLGDQHRNAATMITAKYQKISAKFQRSLANGGGVGLKYMFRYSKYLASINLIGAEEE